MSFLTAYIEGISRRYGCVKLPYIQAHFQSLSPASELSHIALLPGAPPLYASSLAPALFFVDFDVKQQLPK